MSASPEGLSEMQNPRPHPDRLNQDLLANKIPSDSCGSVRRAGSSEPPGGGGGVVTLQITSLHRTPPRVLIQEVWVRQERVHLSHVHADVPGPVSGFGKHCFTALWGSR